jgi:ABC-type sugar transport system ATPase subunit
VSAAPILEARGLSKAFPGVVALDDVGVTLRSGEVIGLIGKNGAGKSTLIKVLAGVETPDRGEVLVNGEVVRLAKPQDAMSAGFAFVHQELTDVPNLTVAENVSLGLGYPKHGPFVSDRGIRHRAAEVLGQLGADLPLDAPVGELSAVNQRVVMIARALAQEARVLVLDEPTASLTKDEIDHLHGVIRRLSGTGICVVYVSHRLDEIVSLTSRVVVMRDGRVVAERPTAEIDRRSLIELITGDREVAETAAGEHFMRREFPADSHELLRVEGLLPAGGTHAASFVARAGEVLGIAGLVGSGRSTLARTICGIHPAAAGHVHLDGKEVKLRSPASAIAAGLVYLPEDRRVEGNVLDFSVRENVTLSSLRDFRWQSWLPFPSRRRERRAAADRVERLRIKVANVEGPTRWLSGGNQQKVLLARWIDREARVFVFDEPTQGIDVEAKEEVFGLIEALAEAGQAILIISSDFSELVRACDRVIALREGEIVAELAGSELSEGEIVRRCYAGDVDVEPGQIASGR